MKTALPAEPGAENKAVAFYKKYQDALHCFASRCQCRSRLCRRRFVGAPAASRLAITTMSSPGRSAWWARKDSLAWRLMRFRPTAVGETLRDTARPSRGSSSLRTASKVKNASWERKPSRKTRENASGFSRRRWRGNRKSVACPGAVLTDRALPGPWRDARSTPCGRPWLPCGRESRACAYGGGCWADRFVS